MNKNLPFKGQMKKVCGTSYHLPLPLEETVKKLCKDTDVINQNHELYIIVRSIPNSSKYVWQNLVDVNKVWKALLWCKQNNPLYAAIELPQSADGIVNILEHLPQTEYQDMTEESESASSGVTEQSVEVLPKGLENNNLTSKKIDLQGGDHNAMLTSVSPSHPMYDQFTIYPIQSSRTNEIVPASQGSRRSISVF